MPAPAEGTQESSASSTQNTGRADNYVPIFDNLQRSYKEFRKRCEIYRRKMTLAGRSKETVFNIVTLLSGKAWDLVDDIPMETLESEDGYKVVFERLDRGFKYDALTELPEDFENFFVRLHRKSNHTLQEYTADFARAERQLRVTHSVDLPEKVKAWWFLRKAGISREQRQLILTNVGTENLSVERTQQAMNFILGQDSKPDPRSRHHKDGVYYGDDGFEVDDGYKDADYDDEVYYQDGVQDEGTPWIDCDQDYYGGAAEYDQPSGDIYDVDEFDEVYATYSDAKAKLNSMRMSRGFYPVVALVDRGSSTAASSSTGGFKGKSKKGKGKGKSKSKDRSQRPVPASKGKARGQAIVGRQICLRCGQAGHWAKNCPQAGDKKRKIEDNDGEIMMVETYALDEGEGDEVESSNLAVQDGGASSVLGSRRSIRRYMRYLVENGFDMADIEVFGCRKSFRYGNSSTGTSTRCILLPMVIGGKKLKVLTYIIDGTAPILFGRPALEQLGVTVDYENRMMRWPGCDWQPIPLGPRGEHQLELVENMGILNSEIEYVKVLAPDDFETHVDYSIPLAVDDVLSLDDGDLLAEHPGVEAGILDGQ